MARARNKTARKTLENYTLVRGATGALYLISETEKPQELKGARKKEVEKILDDCENKLSGSMELVFNCIRLHVGVPTVFVKHR